MVYPKSNLITLLWRPYKPFLCTYPKRPANWKIATDRSSLSPFLQKLVLWRDNGPNQEHTFLVHQSVKIQDWDQTSQAQNVPRFIFQLLLVSSSQKLDGLAGVWRHRLFPKLSLDIYMDPYIFYAPFCANLLFSFIYFPEWLICGRPIVSEWFEHFLCGSGHWSSLVCCKPYYGSLTENRRYEGSWQVLSRSWHLGCNYIGRKHEPIFYLGLWD